MEAGNGELITSRKRTLSGHNQPSHVGGSNLPARRQSSIATLSGRMRAWWSRRNQTSVTSKMIPQGLSPQEKVQYETLLKLVDSRPGLGITTPRVVVITDLAKDYDDLAAMVVLKELDRIGVIKLLGFVANLMPAKRRTEFGRGALNLLDLQRVPIAKGTSGFPDRADRKHEELDYEFACDFMEDPEDPALVEDGAGEALLHKLFSEAEATNEKITLVLISSLEDIYAFSQKYPDLLKVAVSNIVLQGGYFISSEGKLEPDEAAANNRYDIEAARKFHSFMQKSGIPSAVYTKVAAFATPLTSKLFDEMAKTQHKLGQHLRKVQVAQDLAFYKFACNENPKERFAPFMDQKWFLKNKTSWFDKEHPPNAPLPIDAEVVPYLDKVVVYDALAALGSAGQDALDALRVLTDNNAQPPSIHRIVGFAGPPSDPGIHPDQMALVLAALLKGSLLTSSILQR